MIDFAALPKDANGNPIGRYRVRLGSRSEAAFGVPFHQGIGIAEGRPLLQMRILFGAALVIEERLDGPAPRSPLHEEIWQRCGQDGLDGHAEMLRRIDALFAQLDASASDGTITPDDIDELRQRLGNLEDDAEQIELDGSPLLAAELRRLVARFAPFRDLRIAPPPSESASAPPQDAQTTAPEAPASTDAPAPEAVDAPVTDVPAAPPAEATPATTESPAAPTAEPAPTVSTQEPEAPKSDAPKSEPPKGLPPRKTKRGA